MEYKEIKLDEIKVTGLQRTQVDEEKIRSLVGSIKQYGVFEPIIVTPLPEGGYKLVAGLRRLKASKQAEKETIPAMIIEDKDLEFIMLEENLEREDLSPIDEARIYHALLSKGFEVLDLAQRINRSTKYIYQRLELLTLPEEAQKQIEEGEPVDKVKKEISQSSSPSPSPYQEQPRTSSSYQSQPQSQIQERKFTCYYCGKEAELGKGVKFIPVCDSCLGKKNNG